MSLLKPSPLSSNCICLAVGPFDFPNEYSNRLCIIWHLSISYVLLKMFIYLFVYLCMVILLACSSVNHSVCHRQMEAKKGVSDPLEPELQVVVSHLIWVLGIETCILCKSSKDLFVFPLEPCLQPLCYVLTSPISQVLILMGPSSASNCGLNLQVWNG